MTRAYDEAYLDGARRTLGGMLDEAVYGCGLDPEAFFDLFLATDVAERFGRGDVRTVAGSSGAELAAEVLARAGVAGESAAPSYPLGYSREWWAGWALAYYQWLRALSFADIAARVPFGRVLALYDPYHEMDVSAFVQRMDELLAGEGRPTALASRRKQAGLSQSQLAVLSGVSVRSIQQYEQRQKDINKAQVATVSALAQTLCCRIEDLLERA